MILVLVTLNSYIVIGIRRIVTEEGILRAFLSSFTCSVITGLSGIFGF